MMMMQVTMFIFKSKIIVLKQRKINQKYSASNHFTKLGRASSIILSGTSTLKLFGPMGIILSGAFKYFPQFVPVS
jgi:hypothetical protein